MAVLVALSLSSPTAAQPPVREIEIRLYDPVTDEEVGRVSPGGSIEAHVGDEIAMRMTALPGTGGRSARYPSTRFIVPDDSRQVRVERRNEELGAIRLKATGVTQSGATVIQYQILDSLPMPDEMATGRIYLRVRPPRPAEPPPAPAPPPPTAAGPGVEFFEHDGFSGRSQRFTVAELHDLRGNPIGNDSVSSIRIDPGCRLEVFEHQHFQGRSAILTSDVYSMRSTPVGNDAVSSFRLDCRQAGSGLRGVELFEHEDFRGRSQRFTFDAVPDLRSSSVGNDTVSSIRVDPGCRIQMFEHQDYRGRSMVADRDLRTLHGTEVGGDTLSSFRLDCSGRPGLGGRGAILFDGEDFRGVEEIFDRDDPDLRDNKIGDDRARSIRVDRGCQVTLYEEPAYRGRSIVVDRDLSTLRGTAIERDSASSIRVDCRR